MNIAITGHSRGLGRYLSTNLSSNHQVIKTKSRIQDVSLLLEEVRHSDVFINNAHHDFCQVSLFLGLYRIWRLDKSKLIVNVGSRAAEPNISTGFEYSASKAALMHATKSVVFADAEKLCRVNLLNLGLLNSDLPSLEYESVLQVINFILSLDSNIELPIIYVNHAASYLSVQADKKIRASEGKTW